MGYPPPGDTPDPHEPPASSGSSDPTVAYPPPLPDRASDADATVAQPASEPSADPTALFPASAATTPFTPPPAATSQAPYTPPPSPYTPPPDSTPYASGGGYGPPVGGAV